MPMIQAGDHFGAAFATSEQFAAATAGFAAQALAQQAKVIIFPGARTAAVAATITDSLGLAGAVESGQISFADSNSVQLAHGSFDAAYLHQVYSAATGQAVAAGYSGLWVSVDMSWAKPDVVEPGQLTVFEAGAYPLFDSGQLTAMCHYDTALFPAGQIREACAAHPAGPTANLRHHRDTGRLTLRGETDLTNHTAFATLVAKLGAGTVIDLTAMSFLDVAAAVALLDAAAADPSLTIAVTRWQHRLLSLAGVDPAQLRPPG